jgi:hypothetical protein
MLGQPCVTSGRTDNARSCRPRRRQLNSCVALDPGPHGSEWHRTRSSKRSLGGRRTWRPTPPSLRKRESDEAPSVRAVSLAIPPAGGRGVGTASHAPPVTQERAQT